MKISLKIKSPRTIELFQKISKVLIYLLVFLLPIFFLPFTLDPLNFSKQNLLVIFVLIILFIWLLKLFLLGKTEINLNFLNIPILVFLLTYALSTIFSLFRRGSFWGWPLNLSQGFLTLLFFVIFYFLVSNILNKKAEIFRLFLVFVTSIFLATIFAIFQILVRNSYFNTIGTPNSLTIFLAILLPLTILLAIISKKLVRWFLAIYSISFFFFIILVNFSLAWVTLIAGTSILLIFGLLTLKRTDQFGLVFFPILIIILALFFLTFKVSWPKVQLPAEVYLNQKSELEIAKNTLKGLKNLFLGTGPSTFVFDYSQFKPIEINQTSFWAWRFSSGASEIQDKLITSGILGLLSLFFIFGTFFRFGFKNLFSQEDNLFYLGIFASFFGVVFSQFLSPINFSLLFIFWLILASFSSLNPKMKTLFFSARSSFILATFLVLIFLSGISLSFILVKNYFAELRYSQGLNVWQKGELNQAINFLERAVYLNPNSDNYLQYLSQLYLIKLNQSLASGQTLPQSQEIIFQSLDLTKKATEISPKNVANWDARGFIYRNLIGLSGEAENWAIESYQKAMELEPKNPYIFNEIGLVYLAKADLLTKAGGEEKEILENLNLAKDNFQKAIELKLDYAPAHFQLAMIYQREGKTEEAIAKLEETKLIAPFDAGLAFQLGILYYNKNQLEKAKAEFERAVGIDENYSNARYFLGLIYDKEGKKDLAIEQFEKIEKLNPENLEIKSILANLREGKPALEGINLTQPLIEEKPQERLEK
jgi:tetratricopeptide (TPR) repeat protein